MGTRNGYVARAFDTFTVGHLNALRRAWMRCGLRDSGLVDDIRLAPTVFPMDVWRTSRPTHTARRSGAAPWRPIDAIAENTPVVAR
ncbi:MAG: hypothetical protein WBA87_17045 [Microbacterium sp.]